MSRVEIIVCDLHEPSQRSEGVVFRFPLGGVTHEADLCDACQEQLETLLEQIERFTNVARQPAGRQQARRQRARAPRGEQQLNAQIRAWAREQGVECPARGRIPDELRERHRQATAGTPLVAIQ